jgi:amidase
VSSRELLETYLARVEKHNPTLNAVVTLDADARANARRLPTPLARGESWGRCGVPMTIKDSFETAGLRTTAGAPISPDMCRRRTRTR